MITRYRNKALKQLGIAFALLMLAVGLLVLQSMGLAKVIAAVGGMLLVIFAFVFYIQGNIALAKAKGHDGSVVGAIIIVASLCLMGIFFVMPLIILFGLEDKAKRRSFAKDTEPTRHNPPAKLPPIRNDKAP